MAEADRNDTPEWRTLHEYAEQIAGSAEDLKPIAREIACDRFRRAEVEYRYRDAADRLHENDLSDDFRREMLIDVDAGTATRPGKVIPAPPHPADHLVIWGIPEQTRPYPGWPRPPDWPRERKLPDERYHGIEVKALVRRVKAAPSIEPATSTEKLLGEEWVSKVYKREADRLLTMSITEASRDLAHKSETAVDCRRPLKPRYIEALLRKLGGFPKALRNSPKQRPK
jgi:hypothetical protein